MAALLATPLLLPASGAHAAPAARAAVRPLTQLAGPTLGYDRIGVRRGDSWRLRDSLDGGAARVYQEETAGWQPVAGDLDGDGTGAVSLFRDGVWRLRDTEGGPVRTVRFGLKGDRPVVGDWDGDGVDTLGLFRGGRWYLRAGNGAAPTAYATTGFGIPGDLPVVGDWDANGTSDLAVTRGATWFQRDDAVTPTRSFRFGLPGDLPVAGDWDHDGRDTPGVFRRGAWYLEVGNGFGGYRTTSFGAAGDRPVVRRVPGLAPGVSHQVLRVGDSVAHVATVALAAASSPDVVLSGGTLPDLEQTSSMGRRTGAVLAVNGDYFLGSGRPVHALAVDGRLLQTAQVLGRGFSLDATGTRVRMGYPDAHVVLTPGPATTTVVTQWNSGGPSGDAPTGATYAGGALGTPPPDQCYAGATSSAPVVHPDGGVDTVLTVTGTRCYGAPPAIQPGGTVLTGLPLSAGEGLVRGLSVGQQVPMTSSLGFPGAVDLLGGNPLLLVGGVRQDQDLSGPGDYFARQPRTAVGVTGDGRMLVVVVDGRQGAYSAGMTLGELTDLLSGLGAVDAINLDGGGSSTMYLNGVVANRPSDGVERGVGTALAVLPGADPGQADLRVGTSRSAAPRSLLRAGGPAAAPAPRVDPAPAWQAAVRDPGSVGGLADALTRAGTPLPAELRRAAALYEATR